MTVEEFNTLDAAAAARVLGSCAAVDAWIADLLAGRPYPTQGALLSTAERAARRWTPAEVDGALADHPRIGERPSTAAIGAENAAHSRHEQARVSASGAAAKEALVSGNVAYEERFGRVFLIRAEGRTAEQILAALSDRLTNDDVTEDAVVARELREIALLRLGQAVAA